MAKGKRSRKPSKPKAPKKPTKRSSLAKNLIKGSLGFARDVAKGVVTGVATYETVQNGQAIAHAVAHSVGTLPVLPNPMTLAELKRLKKRQRKTAKPGTKASPKEKRRGH